LNTQKQIFLIVVLFFATVGGCAAYTMIDLPYRSEIQQDYHYEESVTRGALLYANNCRTCHGIRGEGGVGLTLNKPEFQDQDPIRLRANKDMLRRTLYCGRAGTLMPAWLNTNGGSLSAIQIEHMINLITSPIEGTKYVDDQDPPQPTSRGWVEAVEFAHNLNHELTAIVGGDTLDSLARAHNIGPGAISALNNNIPPGALLERRTTIKLPPSKQFPEGRDYEVFQTNETINKIADSEHVGAQIIADLNNIAYRLDPERGTFTLLDDRGNAIPGIFPGDTLTLPEGATYTIRAGDTLTIIAEQHGLTPSAIQSLNSGVLGGLGPEEPLPFERTLGLPSGATAKVGEGDTTATIATRFEVTEAALLSANGLQPGAAIAGRPDLNLPAGAQFKISSGDTARSVAARYVGGATAEQLASANNVGPDDVLVPEIVLQLPRVERYVVAGQTLEELARGYSNVTAESLAEANNIPATAVLRVGQSLRLPEDAWGTAPPDTRNAGTACVQHAVPASVYQTLPGVGTPAAQPTTAAPTTVSTTVTITAHANDWTFTADGQAQPPNAGSVLVARGTAINFDNPEGLHTITLNGRKDGADFRQGDTRTVTFNEAGAFKLTCDYHPAMLGTITVQ
jgi:LysM repeat protein/mono/diheme cytochrome c family protein